MKNTYADIEEGQSVFAQERERLEDESKLQRELEAFAFDNSDHPPGWKLGPPYVVLRGVKTVVLTGEKCQTNRPPWAGRASAVSPFDYEEGIAELFVEPTLTARIDDGTIPPAASEADVWELRWSEHGAKLSLKNLDASAELLSVVSTISYDDAQDILREGDTGVSDAA